MDHTREYVPKTPANENSKNETRQRSRVGKQPEKKESGKENRHYSHMPKLYLGKPFSRATSKSIG